MAASNPAVLMASRELRVLVRSRATLGATALLAAVAWLPAILPRLRSASLGLSTFSEALPLQIALGAVVLPLLALLAGAELFAGELEDGSLVPALTLPISRRACYIGKCAGRAIPFAIIYLAAFASIGIATAFSRGTDGWRDWASATLAGLFLSLVTGALGAALGASGRGRVRAFGSALVAWVALVFVLDTLLLTLIVATAPPPPGGVGEHGHEELTPRAVETPAHDPHGRQSDAETPLGEALSGGAMVLNPVSLFRLTTIATSPSLRPRFGLAGPQSGGARLWALVSLGWLAWLALPLGAGLYRFQRAEVH